MQVLGFVPALRDRVHVDVVDAVRRCDDRLQAGLLARFAQRDTPHVDIAVGMAAELQPLTEFAMMGQQRECAGPIDDPGTRRHVADCERALERTGMSRDERAQLAEHRAFAVVNRSVPFELRDELGARANRGTLGVRIHPTVVRCRVPPAMRARCSQSAGTWVQRRMSRGFVKELDDAPDPRDRLAASRAPSETDYFTAEGVASLRTTLARVLDVEERTAIERRLATAIVVEPPADRETVAFGATVVVTGPAGPSTYRIVGTNEIDIERNAVGFHSPLATALIGARVGDIITWHRPAGEQRLTVESVTYPATAAVDGAS